MLIIFDSRLTEASRIETMKIGLYLWLRKSLNSTLKVDCDDRF